MEAEESEPGKGFKPAQKKKKRKKRKAKVYSYWSF